MNKCFILIVVILSGCAPEQKPILLPQNNWKYEEEQKLKAEEQERLEKETQKLIDSLDTRTKDEKLADKMDKVLDKILKDKK